MEKFTYILKTPIYNLIQNYNNNIELYTKNKKKDDEEFYDNSEHFGKSEGVFDGFILLLLIIGIFIGVFIQFWVLWFIISRRNKLSSKMFFLCIFLWFVSWQIPLLPIILIILLVIFAQK